MSVWLIGAGTMAMDYAKVLNAQRIEFKVIGRSESSASKFEAATGTTVVRGGLDLALQRSGTPPQQAIVSVGVDGLSDTSIRLLRAGTRELLVEKPGALQTREMRMLFEEASKTGARVFIAYNRRFYASTLRAKQIIEEDGGMESCHFEFTEWGHEIEGLDKPQPVKERWFLANSTHVVDLAFFLAGKPDKLSTFTAGSVGWHPSAAVFCGAGVTDRRVLFSYQANWGAPGRWGVEVITGKHRLIFRPMESLQVMNKGSVKIEPLTLDDALDKSFKPGLYEQVQRFLGKRYEGLCDVAEQMAMWDIYCKIAAYDSEA